MIDDVRQQLERDYLVQNLLVAMPFLRTAPLHDVHHAILRLALEGIDADDREHAIAVVLADLHEEETVEGPESLNPPGDDRPL